MADPLVDPQMMERLAAQLQARDERERVARLGRAEAAIPPTEELIMSGPVPLEFTPTPSLGPPGPGGIGPRQNLDPRFGDYPAIGVSQKYIMSDPMSGWGEEARSRSVQRGWASPASAESFYPAVEDAYQRLLGQRDREGWRLGGSAEASRLKEEWLGATRQAWGYADPGMEAYKERERLLEEPRAREAARQRRLGDTFGTAEDRARQIMQLEASLFRDGR